MGLDAGLHDGACVEAVRQDYRVLTASLDGTAKIWNVDRTACVMSFEGHQDGVYTAVISPCGRGIATASLDCTAKVWSAESVSCLSTLEGHHDTLNSISFSCDSNLLVTSSSD